MGSDDHSNSIPGERRKLTSEENLRGWMQMQFRFLDDKHISQSNNVAQLKDNGRKLRNH